MPLESPRDFRNATVRLADNSSVELFDDGPLLFSEQEQQLSRLEGASVLLVPLLQRGATICELAAELVSRDVQADDAEQWVTSLLHQLASLALLQTEYPKEGRSAQRRSFQLGAFGFELSYSTDELWDGIAPIFVHLAREPTYSKATFHIADFGVGLIQICENNGPAALVPRDLLAVRLKTILLERMFECGGNVAALHAALMSEGSHGVLLLGSPGAGKSTLALALLNIGYDYGSDDVTLINSDGTVTGLPLAPGVKEGSWAIAEELGAELTALPAHVRSDGQRVRFARVGDNKVVRSCSVDTIVTLHRNDRAVARVLPMNPHEVLAELLRESRASGGTCSVETMVALARLVRGAAAFHVHYAEAMEAANLIATIRK